jgi:hypothetical protein
MNLTLEEERLKVFILQKLQENQGTLDIKENFEIEEAAKQLGVLSFRIHNLKQEAMNEFVEIPVAPTNPTITEEDTTDNEQNTEVQTEEKDSSATTTQQENSMQQTSVSGTPEAPPSSSSSEFTSPNTKPREEEPTTTTENKPAEGLMSLFLSKKYYFIGGLMAVLGIISIVLAIIWKSSYRPTVYTTECHKNSTLLHYVGELEREYLLEWQPLNSSMPQTYKFRIYDVDREGIFRFDIEGLGSKYQGLYGKVVDFQLSLDTLGLGILEKSKTHYTIKSLRKRPRWTATAQYCR